MARTTVRGQGTATERDVNPNAKWNDVHAYAKVRIEYPDAHADVGLAALVAALRDTLHAMGARPVTLADMLMAPPPPKPDPEEPPF